MISCRNPKGDPALPASRGDLVIISDDEEVESVEKSEMAEPPTPTPVTPVTDSDSNSGASDANILPTLRANCTQSIEEVFPCVEFSVLVPLCCSNKRKPEHKIDFCIDAEEEDEIRMDKIYSKPYTDSRGNVWRLMWFPFGNSQSSNDHISCFLEMKQGSTKTKKSELKIINEDGEEEDEEEEEELDVEVEIEQEVEFYLTLINQREKETHSIAKPAEYHAFSSKFSDWGFTQFVARDDIIDPSSGFIVYSKGGDQSKEDSFVEIYIRIQYCKLNRYNPNNSLVANNTLSANGYWNNSNNINYYLDYDSKKETGMVGLKNQGATCYMNSLLQTLFHIGEFRKAVYDTPTALHDTTESVCLALQRVFYRLQTYDVAVSTKELTKSFGWSHLDSFMQHDVQELYRILCDRLESKMKEAANSKSNNDLAAKNDVDGVKSDKEIPTKIQQLFEGKVRSFIKCVNVDFSSSRVESFYDLSLDVKGCKDMYESFAKYTEVELLEGENQYEASDALGKQDAEKGVSFMSLPPVLNIQLKRFEFDPFRDGMVKVHDRFEFTKVLDLNPYTVSTNEENNIYHLHSVLVHSGDVHGGHYYVYIRHFDLNKHKKGGMDDQVEDADDDEWFKFDDDRITKVSEECAVDGNFGGSSECIKKNYRTKINNTSGGGFLPSENSVQLDDSFILPSVLPGADDLSLSSPPSVAMSPLQNTSSFSSAYMLVYIREKELPTVLVPPPSIVDPQIVTDEVCATKCQNVNVDIPELLRKRFQAEEAHALEVKKELEMEHLMMTLKIATDWSLSNFSKITKTSDFCSFSNSNDIWKMRVLKKLTMFGVMKLICERYRVPIHQQRLWLVITRENKTVRPDQPITRKNELNKPCSTFLDGCSRKSTLNLFLEIMVPASPTLGVLKLIHWQSLKKKEKKKKRKHDELLMLSENSSLSSDSESCVSSSSGSNKKTKMDEACKNSIFSIQKKGSVKVVEVPPLPEDAILLFVKCYDVSKPLNQRLCYMGNIVVNGTITGMELQHILFKNLMKEDEKLQFEKDDLNLYEEVQPQVVNILDLSIKLSESELQHGDIICYQTNQKLSQQTRENNEITEEEDGEERYPTVVDYFKYLLDRCEITFRPLMSSSTTVRFYHAFISEQRLEDVSSDTVPNGIMATDGSFVAELLYGDSYVNVIGVLSDQIFQGLIPSNFIRLHQCSPITNNPKEIPNLSELLHDDDEDCQDTEHNIRATLGELLMDYSQRGNEMFYEILDFPVQLVLNQKSCQFLISNLVDGLDCLTSPAGLLQPKANIRTISSHERKRTMKIKILLCHYQLSIQGFIQLIQRQLFRAADKKQENILPLRLYEIKHGVIQVMINNLDYSVRFLPVSSASTAKIEQYLFAAQASNNITDGNEDGPKQSAEEMESLYRVHCESHFSGIFTDQRMVLVDQVDVWENETLSAINRNINTNTSSKKEDQFRYISIAHLSNVLNNSNSINSSPVSLSPENDDHTFKYHTHSAPLVVIVLKEDTFLDLKKRIQRKLNVPDTTIRQWRLSRLVDSCSYIGVYLESAVGDLDNMNVFNFTSLWNSKYWKLHPDSEDLPANSSYIGPYLPVLGLEYPDPNPAPPSPSTLLIDTANEQEQPQRFEKRQDFGIRIR